MAIGVFTIFIQNAHNHSTKSTLRCFGDPFHIHHHLVLLNVLCHRTQNTHESANICTMILREKSWLTDCKIESRFKTCSICSVTEGAADDSFWTGLKSSCESAPSPATLIPARCWNHGTANPNQRKMMAQIGAKGTIQKWNLCFSTKIAGDFAYIWCDNHALLHYKAQLANGSF